MLNLPLPDSAMAIQAANTDRQTDTDPHMVIVLLLVGTACYVSLYISVTIETYKHCQFVPRASNLLLYPCKFITLLQQQILTFLQQRMPATTLMQGCVNFFTVSKPYLFSILITDRKWNSPMPQVMNSSSATNFVLRQTLQ